MYERVRTARFSRSVWISGGVFFVFTLFVMAPYYMKIHMKRTVPLSFINGTLDVSSFSKESREMISVVSDSIGQESLSQEDESESSSISDDSGVLRVKLTKEMMQLLFAKIKNGEMTKPSLGEDFEFCSEPLESNNWYNSFGPLGIVLFVEMKFAGFHNILHDGKAMLKELKKSPIAISVITRDIHNLNNWILISSAADDVIKFEGHDGDTVLKASHVRLFQTHVHATKNKDLKAFPEQMISFFNLESHMVSTHPVPIPGIVSCHFSRNSEVPVSYVHNAFDNMEDFHMRVEDSMKDGPFDPARENVSFVVSNCHGPRKEYMKDLMNSIQVASYGNCHQNKKANSEDEKAAFNRYPYAPNGLPLNDPYPSYVIKQYLCSRHRFHGAFENQRLVDYHTEKYFYTLGYHSVPIIYGGDGIEFLYPGDTPPGIKTSDFETPEALADYVKKVAANDTLYDYYTQWKTKPIRQEFQMLFNASINNVVYRLPLYAAKEYLRRSCGDMNDAIQELATIVNPYLMYNDLLETMTSSDAISYKKYLQSKK